MAPFGCGFLYLSKDFRAKLKPPLAGYLSVTDPEGGWDTYFETPSIVPVRDYDFVDNARRFETGGTANYPGAIGLAESVGLINQIGIENVGHHVISLTSYLIDALHHQQLRVITPEAREHRSGIVTFTLDRPEDNLALIEYLQAQKVLVSVRYTSNVGGVRVSCHLFNNIADLDRLVEGVSTFIKRSATAAVKA